MARATEIGTTYTAIGDIEVIISHVNAAEIQNTPNADVMNSTTLLYVRPEDLPTCNLSELIASYVVKDDHGLAYNIRQAAEGYNQETGQLEHVELSVEPTDLAR